MKKTGISIIILVFIDQFIKISLILTNFKNTYSLFNDLIGIKLKLNTEELSIFNSYNHYVDTNWLIFLNLFIILFLLSLVSYKQYLKNQDELLDYLLIFLLSGAFASALDKIFFRGSLDYLVVFEYIIDLKDIYLGIALCLSLLYSNQKRYSSIEIVKNYFSYLKMLIENKFLTKK